MKNMLLKFNIKVEKATFESKGVFFVIQLRTTRDIEFYKALFTTCKLVRDIGQRSPNS